jgi:branched-chain amino acid transport system permease protein
MPVALIIFLQQVTNGLMAGAAYSLVALGFTLTFGVLRVLNLVHPEVVMVGAFVGYLSIILLSSNFVFALAVAMVGSAVLGVIIERVALRPFRHADYLMPLISTIALSIVLQNGMAIIFGTDATRFPPALPTIFYNVGGIQISTVQITVFATALVLMFVLKYCIDRTRMGRAIRATAEDAEVAAFFGVNVSLVIVLTVAISSALAGAAGVLIGSLYNTVWPYMGINYGLKGLVIMIVGGVGSMEGAMLGGLLLGVIEALTIGYLSSTYRDAIAFGVLIVILLLRPHGIFGERVKLEGRPG